MPLTDTQLKNLKPKTAPYRVADGGGLFIEVRKRGSKLWRFTGDPLGLANEKRLCAALPGRPRSAAMARRASR